MDMDKRHHAKYKLRLGDKMEILEAEHGVVSFAGPLARHLRLMHMPIFKAIYVVLESGGTMEKVASDVE